MKSNIGWAIEGLRRKKHYTSADLKELHRLYDENWEMLEKAYDKRDKQRLALYQKRERRMYVLGGEMLCEMRRVRE